MSIAWRAAQLGWAVNVFDHGAIGGEASWAGAGMLAPGGEVEGSSPLATLAIESRRLYRDFVHQLEESSATSIDYQECGGLDVAYSPAELEALNARADVQAALGIASKLLTPAQISAFWPRVRSEGLVGGRFYPDDAIVNPREIVAALRIACEKLGVSVLPNCAVSRIEIAGNSARVKTSRDEREYQAAVIAAGSWSSMVEVAGVPAIPACEPIKGQLIGYQQPDQTCSTIVRHGHTYALQRANGMLITGASVEHAGFDREVKPDIMAELASRAGFLFPHLLETTPSESWIGFRPGGDSPHIGVWHSPRLYLAYGHFRNGILLAPVTAERVAGEIRANLRMR